MPNLMPLSKETLAEQIAAQITSAILSGVYPVGFRLVEAELAQQLNTSRGPIREAIRHVSQSGLIEVRPRQGSFVTKFAETDWAEIVVVRAVLEGVAARLVCANSEPDTVALLEERVGGIVLAGSDRVALRVADWRFHEEMCRLSGNKVVLREWAAMRDSISVLMSQGRAEYSNPATVAESHQHLVDVLRECDPASAETVVRARLLKSGFAWLHEAIPAGLQ